MLRTFCAASAVTLAACAGHHSTPCDPVPAELVQFAARQVYRACEVTSEAIAPRVLRTIPSTSVTSNNLPCVRAAIEFVVDSAGWPLVATARIVRTNDSTYAKDVIGAIGGSRFTPAQKDGRPVAQLAVIDRSASGGDLGGKVPFAVKRIDGPPPPAAPRAGC